MATASSSPATPESGTRLEKGVLTLPNCIALSAAVMAPVLAVILNAPAAGPVAGSALPIAFLVAFVAAAFVANTVIEFAKRLPSSGSFYTFCSNSLGPGAGFFTGWLYFAAFVLLTIGLFTANGAFLKEYLDSTFGLSLPWWILSLLLMALAFALSITSIKTSVRLDLALLVAEMLIFVVLAAIAILRAGDGNSLSYFDPTSAPDGISGAGLGVVFGILSFIGFEAAAVLGEETRNPRRSVPIAVGGALVGIGVFYIFVLYGLAAGYGLNSESGLNAFLEDPTPFPTLADMYAPWLTQLVQIAAILGLFSVLLAVLNTTVRVIYSMARESVLPTVLARVHPRWHSPYTAIYALTAVSIGAGLALAAWIGAGVTDVYGFTGSIGTVAIVLVYIMANVALIKFYWGDPQFNALRHLVAPVAGILVLLYPLYSTSKPGQEFPYSLVPYAVLFWIVVGLLVYAYLKQTSPEKIRAIGSTMADEEIDFVEERPGVPPEDRRDDRG